MQKALLNISQLRTTTEQTSELEPELFCQSQGPKLVLEMFSPSGLDESSQLSFEFCPVATRGIAGRMSYSPESIFPTGHHYKGHWCNI